MRGALKNAGVEHERVVKLPVFQIYWKESNRKLLGILCLQLQQITLVPREIEDKILIQELFSRF